MVQIISADKRRSKSEQFGEAFSRGSQLVTQHLQQRNLQKEEDEALAREFPGTDFRGFSPETKKSLIGEKIKARQDSERISNEYENEMQLLNQKHEFAKEIKNLELSGKKEEATQKIQETLKPFEGALQTIGDMRKLRKRGNLGLFSKVTSPFSSETRKDRGAYQTLGNSLIGYASTIPIRNQKEFEQLTGKLNDPNITDSEAEGVLNSIEKIIQRSMEPFKEYSKQVEIPGITKNRPPLSQFKR